MDTDPFRSSILSIMKIATIDVNAIVIYMFVYHMSKIHKSSTATTYNQFAAHDTDDLFTAPNSI